MVEVDGNFAAVAHLVPRGREELAIRQPQALRAGAHPVGGDNNDGGGIGEERDERNNAVDECREQRFHARHGNAFRDGFRDCPK